jgi:hypothetical protein
MAKRKLKQPPKRHPPQTPDNFRGSPATLTVHNPHAAGIDVHSDKHVVCVGPDLVQDFGAYTADLRAIAAHLRHYGVTTVAMESTGVYWIPLYELLEAEGFAVFLVEPGQLKHCGARPGTDARPSGSNGCTPTACCAAPSARPRPSSGCAATGGSGRRSSPWPACTCSTCKRPWSR